jgi:ferredoxin
MKKVLPVDCSQYDVLGFAFFADLMRPSPYFIDFVSKLEGLEEKPAFIINTFGSTGGRAPEIAYHLLRTKGMVVFASHSLHTPESYPPLIKTGLGFENHPTPRGMRRFEAFITRLDKCIREFEAGENLSSSPPKLDLIARLAPRELDRLLPRQFGPKRFAIAEKECVRCGRCARNCPGKAISLDGDPQIVFSLCQQCWACYNACPKKAIRVGKLQGEAQYSGPSASLRIKLLDQR